MKPEDVVGSNPPRASISSYLLVMKITHSDMEHDQVVVLLNGEIVGYLLEADDSAGYVVQHLPGGAPQRLTGNVSFFFPQGDG